LAGDGWPATAGTWKIDGKQLTLQNQTGPGDGDASDDRSIHREALGDRQAEPEHSNGNAPRPNPSRATSDRAPVSSVIISTSAGAMPLDLVISHYRVLEAIGEGGMGEVYLGVDETLRRKVALKSILPEHRLHPAIKARFLREARTLSQLDHPNICRVHDYIESDDRDWIVLELVEGRTLADALAHGGKGLDRLAIARQIASVPAA
jgi:serine/threonine protein kinase